MRIQLRFLIAAVVFTFAPFTFAQFDSTTVKMPTSTAVNTSGVNSWDSPSGCLVIFGKHRTRITSFGQTMEYREHYSKRQLRSLNAAGVHIVWLPTWNKNSAIPTMAACGNETSRVESTLPQASIQQDDIRQMLRELIREQHAREQRAALEKFMQYRQQVFQRPVLDTFPSMRPVEKDQEPARIVPPQPKVEPHAAPSTDRRCVEVLTSSKGEQCLLWNDGATK